MRASLCGGEAPKYQQVVLRGVVVMRGQLRIEQVRHMQVDQLQPGKVLQAALNFCQTRLEGRASAGNPDKALRGHVCGQGRQLVHAPGVDMKNAHTAKN